MKPIQMGLVLGNIIYPYQNPARFLSLSAAAAAAASSFEFFSSEICFLSSQLLESSDSKKKMNLLRNVIRSNGSLRIQSNQSLPLLLHRNSPRHFSTETEQQQSNQPQQQQQQENHHESVVDSFVRPSSQGLVYGKLSGNNKHTMKTDIINMLEGCNLTPQDVKVEYNRSFAPTGMIVQFSSRSAFDNAVRAINKKGRLLRLEKVDRGHWEIQSYGGKSVLLQGIPRQALPEDIERFLSGYDFDSSNMQIVMRGVNSEPVRMAVVNFPSRFEAMSVVLVKNRGFCLNNQISMRVLQ